MGGSGVKAGSRKAEEEKHLLHADGRFGDNIFTAESRSFGTAPIRITGHLTPPP